MNKIRLLVVDDSILFREVLARYIRRDEEIEVVGTAGDAYAAHDLILRTEPDVMTLDVEMPRMDGIAFLKKLLPQHYLPTIVVSSSEGKRDAALEAGAVKFIAKQSARTGTDMERFAKEVCEAIKEIKRTRKRPAEKAPEKKIEKPSGVGAVSRGEIRRTAVHTSGVRRSDPVVVLGASTGGTDALEQVLRAFPKDMPPVLVVQHMPAGFTKMYAERLNRSCKMTVKEAEDGDRLQRGLVIIGAGENQLRLLRDGRGYYISSKPGEKVSGHCPSVDVLFSSAAEAAGKNAVGAIFTGMGKDGAEGLLKMRNAGAFTVGQDKETCVVYGMPMEAYKIGAVEVQAPLYNIADIIMKAIL